MYELKVYLMMNKKIKFLIFQLILLVGDTKKWFLSTKSVKIWIAITATYLTGAKILEKFETKDPQMGEVIELSGEITKIQKMGGFGSRARLLGQARTPHPARPAGRPQNPRPRPRFTHFLFVHHFACNTVFSVTSLNFWQKPQPCVTRAQWRVHHQLAPPRALRTRDASLHLLVISLVNSSTENAKS